MALGAQKHDVIQLIAAQTLAPVAIGLISGTAAATVLTRYLAAQLFGVRPFDAVTIAGVVFVLAAVALAACAIPAMRAARKGRIFNLSSLAGIRGTEFASLYCSSKFALEGFSEALAQELAPFGIFVTIVEPGPFRTDFLTRESLRFGGRPLDDYNERRAKAQASFELRSGQQPGDPAFAHGGVSAELDMSIYVRRVRAVAVRARQFQIDEP